MGFQRQIAEALAALEHAGLLRTPLAIESGQGPEIVIGGRRVVCLCSNDYLGLAQHPALAAAAAAAAHDEGAGAASSRLITGTMAAHLDAEAALAEYVHAPAAVLFSSGYAANVGAIQALVGKGDAVFSDALNHASLIDGARLSRASVHVYPHRDLDRLREMLARHRASARRALIVTDSLFSMDGVTAPVEGLSALASEFEAGLMVDEAHALGVLGPHGAGVCAAADVTPDVLIGTLGKSFGVAGAFVAGSRELTSLIRNRARSFVFSTAPPPMVARAAIAALQRVREADEARATLLGHAERLRVALARLGFDVQPGDTQIVPVLIGGNDRTMQLSAELLHRGVFVQGIRPPTVAEGTARLRLTPMATHRSAHIERAIEAFASLDPN